jgi:hypothetical protein
VPASLERIRNERSETEHDAVAAAAPFNHVKPPNSLVATAKTRGWRKMPSVPKENKRGAPKRSKVVCDIGTSSG